MKRTIQLSSALDNYLNEKFNMFHCSNKNQIHDLKTFHKNFKTIHKFNNSNEKKINEKMLLTRNEMATRTTASFSIIILLWSRAAGSSILIYSSFVSFQNWKCDSKRCNFIPLCNTKNVYKLRVNDTQLFKENHFLNCCRQATIHCTIPQQNPLLGCKCYEID